MGLPGEDNKGNHDLIAPSFFIVASVTYMPVEADDYNAPDEDNDPVSAVFTIGVVRVEGFAASVKGAVC